MNTDHGKYSSGSNCFSGKLFNQKFSVIYLLHVKIIFENDVWMKKWKCHEMNARDGW